MRFLITAPYSARKTASVFSHGLQSLGDSCFLIITNQPVSYFAAGRGLIQSPFRGLSFQFFKKHCAVINQKIIKAAQKFNPDIIFTFGCEFISEETIFQISAELTKPRFLWLIEDPCSVDYFDKFKIQKFQSYSHIIVPDEGWLLSLVFAGDKKIHYLPYGGNHLDFSPSSSAKKNDVLFIGDLKPTHPFTPIGPIRQYVLKALKKHKFKLKFLSDQVPVKTLNRCLNYSRIAVFINHGHSKADPAANVFDYALSGTLVIADYRFNTPKIFNEPPTFSSLKELIDLLNFYLDCPKIRESAAEKMLVAAQSHTWLKRVKAIRELIS